MSAHQTSFSVDQMACVLGVSRSGYYRFLHHQPSQRSLHNERLVDKITLIHQASFQTYGSPRIHAELREAGESCSRPRVARLMKAHNIQAKMYKKFKKTPLRSDKPYARAQDLVHQNFHVKVPNTVWAADITYIKIHDKWCYLAVILDVFSRKIVGMSVKEQRKTDLVLEALNQALLGRKPPPGLIHHSDLGSQYTSDDFYKITQKHGIRISHGKTGCAYDNAVVESFFHTLKTELVYFKSYPCVEAARLDIFTYIFTYYNSKRRHSTLHYKTPNQVEKNYYETGIVSIHSV